MRPEDRIITRLPLQELFDGTGPVDAVRQRDLSVDDIRELLRDRPFRFVVATVGSKPVWVAEADQFAFWKTEVVPHLAGSVSEGELDKFAGGYCYFASEWLQPDETSIVLLEVAH
jgi:hypothetical protein